MQSSAQLRLPTGPGPVDLQMHAGASCECSRVTDHKSTVEKVPWQLYVLNLNMSRPCLD